VPMNDDRSFRDDPAVPLSIRRDLERYAQGTAVLYDKDRGLERLAASLAIASTAAAPSLATGLKTLATKVFASGFHVVAVCVAIGAAGAAIVHAEHARLEAAAPVPVAPVPLATATPQKPAAPSAGVASNPPERETVATATTSSALAPTVTPKAPVQVAKSLRHKTSAPTAGSSLREEMSALLHLREVASSDPSAAVGLAAEEDARYGKGSFYAEEREAIAIDALARSGRTDEARARATAFLSLHAKSPFATRVRSVLAP
jgi:hypothetical protein